MTPATIKGAAAMAAPDVAELRRTRTALAQAIADGQTHLAELYALVEDQLVEALAAQRRDREVNPR